MNQTQIAIYELIVDSLDNIERNNPGEIINWVARNLIAKFSLANDYYFITKFTKNQLELSGIDYRKRANKIKKNNYTFEHPVPSKVVLNELLKVKKDSDRLEILKYSDCVVILSRDEDEKLSSAKLKSSMPKNWKYFDNIFARYESIGIDILDEKIKMIGAIKR